MKQERCSAPVGRPRAFDADEALERALQVFWQKGYEGTSLSDLTEAMGINRPSLYATFGNKETLFRKALDRYMTGPAAHVYAALTQPTAREAVEQLLRGTVDSLSDPCRPRGCLMVQGALCSGDEAAPIRQELVARRAASQELLKRRFEQAQQDGDLPADFSADDLARYIATVIQGLGVQAVGDVSREELLRVVETAMLAWPA